MTMFNINRMAFRMSALILMLAAILFSFNTIAAPINDVTSSSTQTEKKIQLLTHLLENRNKMQNNLQNQVEELSEEVNILKGNNDELNYKLSQMEKRQRDIMLMISDLEVVKPTSTANAETENTNKTEQSSYQRAVDLVLKSKDYKQAIAGFTLFVNDYPKSALVANSQYWLGQLFYKEKKLKEAKLAFSVVVEKFPKSSKRADAILKVGVIDDKLGDVLSAKKSYKQVLAEYPTSSAADLAAKRLKGL